MTGGHRGARLVIAVDASRADGQLPRRRGATARRPSRANALHFASDLPPRSPCWSASLLVSAGEHWADSVAALFVAVLVVLAALRLAKRSVDVLMDRAAADADERIRAALAQLDEQVEVRRVRVRHAAGRHFVDLVVGVPLDTGVTPGARDRRRHRGRDRARARRRRRGGARRAVEAEGGVRERATAAARAIPEVREVHNVRVMRLPDGYELSLHVKLPRELSLERGARRGGAPGAAGARASCRSSSYVHTHIEPLARTDWASAPDHRRDRRSSARRSRRRCGASPARAARGELPRRRAGPRGARHGEPPGRRSRCPRRTGTRARSRRPCASAAPTLGGRDRAHRADGGGPRRAVGGPTTPISADRPD